MLEKPLTQKNAHLGVLAGETPFEHGLTVLYFISLDFQDAEDFVSNSILVNCHGTTFVGVDLLATVGLARRAFLQRSLKPLNCVFDMFFESLIIDSMILKYATYLLLLALLARNWLNRTA